METVPISLIVKDSLYPIALLDNDLRLVNYSNSFLETFTTDKTEIQGESILDIIQNSPEQFKQHLEESLQGGTQLKASAKFTLPNGNTPWLKWKLQVITQGEDMPNCVLVMLEDITEEKRNAELLLRAELVSRTGSWEVDLVQNTVFWSPMTKIIHEVPSDYLPTIAGGINFYKEGFYRDLISELVNDAMADGKPWDTELIIVTTKGKELWVRAKGEAELVNGTCTRISGTFQDIDEKKKIELKYNETAERLKIATNTANIGIWEYEITANKLLWDDNMYTLYGVKPDDFSGVYEAWQNGLHPDDIERCQLEIDDAIAGKQAFDTEFRILWPDGSVRNIKAIALTESDEQGKALKMIGANWDITELKTTQLELERNNESFLDTFNNSAIGMALVGLDGQWIRVNKTLCESFGYTEKELSKTNFKDITHVEDIAPSIVLMQDTINGKRDSYQLEKRYLHKNGSLVYAIVTVTVVRDIYGKISHLVTQVLDVTSRKTAEKKLESLVEVTKVQNDSLLNFAHIVSHNLRSHSSNMSMLTQFLSQENDKEERQNINQMLLDATTSLSETIQHLNDVVQVKTDSSENMRPVNLLSTLNHIENSIQGLLTKEDAKTKIMVSESHNVKVVPAYLESILLNLYTNSLKYRSPTRKPIISISSILKESTVLIEFKDNGLGIDLKRHGDKLFGMYKTFHKHKEANGIGLFITKNQIESMNGTITVDSTVDVGTTFLITLEQG